VFKVATFHLDISVQMSSLLPDCHVNHFGEACPMQTQCTHTLRQRFLFDVGRPFLASLTTLCSLPDSSPDCSVARVRAELSLGFQ